MDSQPRKANITRDQTKYDFVVGSLGSATLANVAGASDAENDKYQVIKMRLTNDYADIKNRKLRELLQESECRDNKSSQLLRQMCYLSSSAPKHFGWNVYKTACEQWFQLVRET